MWVDCPSQNLAGTTFERGWTGAAAGLRRHGNVIICHHPAWLHLRRPPIRPRCSGVKDVIIRHHRSVSTQGCSPPACRCGKAANVNKGAVRPPLLILSPTRDEGARCRDRVLTRILRHAQDEGVPLGRLQRAHDDGEREAGGASPRADVIICHHRSVWDAVHPGFPSVRDAVTRCQQMLSAPAL